MDERFEAIAAFAAIGDFVERPVKTYSSGMFVRLAFAVSTAVEPDILVVDEALSVGDEAFQRKCFARIEAIKDRGGTILFVSHGAQTIVQLCDRAILMDAGENILEGEPKRVVGQYQRLVNASAEAAAAIRAEMIDYQADPAVADTKLSLDFERAENDSPADFFDSSLQTESRIDVGTELAKIKNVIIKSMDGRIVNQLKCGKKYFIFYDVDIISDFSDFSFGYSIKTVDGYHIAGCSSRDLIGKKMAYCAGDKANVQFEFICRLLPNIYFLTIGVGGRQENNDNDVVGHRILDALPFRVIEEGQTRINGIVDMEPICRII
ncbi:MAG: ABC transporter ATP-binding protein [Phyllobacteriaceae bacterium]|nr:ABC transporter ATP-binding protein [Phyllobacteriaceae bacterium]